MKIVHVVWGMPTGGVENMLVDIVDFQSKYNDISVIIVNDMDNRVASKINENAKVYYCGRKIGSKNPLPFIYLNFLLYKINPDVCHVHFENLYKFIKWGGIKVRTVHNTGLFEPADLKYYNGIYAISDIVKEEWLHKGVDIKVVANGISCKNIRNTPKDVSKIKHFVQISRILFEQKGQDILVNALIKVAKIRRDFVMHFVGGGPDEETLRSMIFDQGLEDVVVIDGLKDRDWVYQNLCNFDLFIQPSRFEGFGLTVAEACAAKIPVLVSNIEGPLEVLDSGRLGWTFKNKNVDDLADKILMFLEGEYDYSLIEKAYQRTIKNYDVSRTAKQYLDEYKKLTNNK